MNILILKNKDETFTVSVSVEPVGEKGKEEFVDTKIIKKYLEDKKYKYGKCLQSAVVSNVGKLVGEWIFEDLNPTRIKKNIDKIEKSVLNSNKVKKNTDKETSD